MKRISIAGFPLSAPSDTIFGLCSTSCSSPPLVIKTNSFVPVCQFVKKVFQPGLSRAVFLGMSESTQIIIILFVLPLPMQTAFIRVHAAPAPRAGVSSNSSAALSFAPRRPQAARRPMVCQASLRKVQAVASPPSGVNIGPTLDFFYPLYQISGQYELHCWGACAR